MKKQQHDANMFYQKQFYKPAPPINGEEYAHLPNPAENLKGDYQVDPNRGFIPDPQFRTSLDQLNRGSGDSAIERVPIAATTEFLGEYHTVDSIDIKVPAHGVFVPNQLRGLGWKQQWIPGAERRSVYAVSAPPPMLSKPIRELTVDPGLQGKRVPVKLKAPKPNKGD